MNKSMKQNSWVLAIIIAGMGFSVLAHGADTKAKAKKIDPALEQAQKQEKVVRAEENSREMARSAIPRLTQAPTIQGNSNLTPASTIHWELQSSCKGF